MIQEISTYKQPELIFKGCSNYPTCKFTLSDNFRHKKLTKTNVSDLIAGKEALFKS